MDWIGFLFGKGQNEPPKRWRSEGMEYRILTAGEEIEKEDESLDDNCITWSNVGILFSRCYYDPNINTPIRRKISAETVEE